MKGVACMLAKPIPRSQPPSPVTLPKYIYHLIVSDAEMDKELLDQLSGNLRH